MHLQTTSATNRKIRIVSNENDEWYAHGVCCRSRTADKMGTLVPTLVL